MSRFASNSLRAFLVQDLDHSRRKRRDVRLDRHLLFDFLAGGGDANAGSRARIRPDGHEVLRRHNALELGRHLLQQTFAIASTEGVFFVEADQDAFFQRRQPAQHVEFEVAKDSVADVENQVGASGRFDGGVRPVLRRAFPRVPACRSGAPCRAPASRFRCAGLSCPRARR